MISMPAIDEDMPTIGCIPHLHHEVGTSRGDTFAIRGPGHRIHTISMPAIGEDMPTIGGIPHLHCVVGAPRGDTFAIRGPGHRIDTSGMAAISVESCRAGGRSGRLGCGDGVALEC